MERRWSPLVALALVVAAAPAPAQQAGPPDPALDPGRAYETDVLAALESLRSAGPGGVPACREGLAAFGRPVVPTLVRLLMDPTATADERGPLVDATAQAVLMDVLSERPSAEVLPELHDTLPGIDALELRRRAVKILGQLGDSSSFEPLIELVAGMESVRRQVPTIQRELETALTRILQRDPRTYTALTAPTERLEPLLQATVARALGAAGSSQGLAGLERMMGRTLEIDRAVLEAIGRLAPEDAGGQRSCAAMLAWHLTSEDPEARRFAATSLGSHGGADQLDGLIALLEDPDRRVQRAAEWSLRQISGMDFGLQTAPWSSWLQRELLWYQEDAPQLVQAAVRGQPGPAYGAMRELSGHALFRRELTDDLTPVLQRRETALAVAACNALARLGSPSARDPLEATRGDPRAEVAHAAETALRALDRD